MEEALALLSDGGTPPLAPGLQQEIQESLQQLRPQVILDHIKVGHYKRLLTQPKSHTNLSKCCKVHHSLVRCLDADCYAI